MAAASSLPDKYTLQAFQRKEQDEVSQITKVVQTSFVQKIKNQLKLLGYEEDELDEVTNEVLFEGVEIYENSDDQSEDIQKLNYLQEIHSGLYDRAVLIVLVAKVVREKIAKEGRDDRYFELYPEIMSKPDKNPKQIMQATTYLDIKRCTHDFIIKFAKKTKKMVLIIHVDGGIRNFEELHNLGFNNMVADLKKSLYQVTITEDSDIPQLPQTIDIVLERKGYIEVKPFNCIDTESALGTEKKIVINLGTRLVNGSVPVQCGEDTEESMQVEDKWQEAERSSIISEPCISSEVHQVSMDTDQFP